MKESQPNLRPEILIVDDTTANLRLLSQMLSSNGYQVRAVTSGERALASIEITAPSLILLDIKMPIMDGYEVCRRLKSSEKTRDIPVIFISALNEIEDKVKAFKAGAVDYITKPFQLEEVLARTETHLALRQLQRQLQEANLKFEKELALAGRTQASFLPSRLPNVRGWNFSAKLCPARETSGDFFDVFRLPTGLIGILIADVVDKGVGAALFMALSYSLLRSYAAEYPQDPSRILAAVNQHILQDTETDQFVTVFFAVLDPTDGRIIYANAGQDPPLLVIGPAEQEVTKLEGTGIPLGVLGETRWKEKDIMMEPGDMLVLYTDGITDAQDDRGNFFGKTRLENAVKIRIDQSAEAVRDGILADVSAFSGDAVQFDDMALVIVKREAV
jgi:sigma-B regulation protein RsbU (phosphoserine phosphatase)